ncbi:MAG: ATP-dependent DNA helicase [Limnohabitans sp.]
MSELQDWVRHFLSGTGTLAITSMGFQERAGQQQMAQAVAQTIEQGGELVVEAGTGVGKTYAYLVPVLLSGQRALISTATKALQDQLFSRDIPGLLAIMGLPVRVALLKGRASYLCLHRLQTARQDDIRSPHGQAHALSRIERWAQSTRSGDLAELTGLDENSTLIPQITSTRENCLGSQCPEFKACHVNLARKEALSADIVVINHHLFFADMAVRESGVAELLPNVRITVFDEAHQLNDIGVNFLGQQISTTQLLDLSRDLKATGLTLAQGLADWQALAQGLEIATRQWRLAAGEHRTGARLGWKSSLPEGVNGDDWMVVMNQLGQALEATCNGLEPVSETAPELSRQLQRARHLQALLRDFLEPPPEDRVRWLDVSGQMKIMESPLDIAQAFSGWVRGAGPYSGPEAAEAVPVSRSDSAESNRARAWIFTSATLGEDEQLRWFTEPCGLSHAQVLQVDSPFDYARQAAVHVPEAMVLPSDSAHPLAVAHLAAKGAGRLGGRTLVLTTTLQAMRTISTHLSALLDPAQGLELLVQGQWPKRRLMERFRLGAQPGQGGCVLVASASFWEGFDVPGAALELVVIDKLPFPPPGDPLFQARGQRLQTSGRSPFVDLALPEAIIALKQGAGRLIRSETDRGILVIADVRLRRKGYGQRLRQALPAMRWLHDDQAFEEALAALTTASTMDRER